MLSIEYSVLCHYPAIMSKDCITLGIIFLNKTSETVCFYSTKNFKRVRSFNDELDIDFLKIQLEAIEDEVNSIKVDNSFKLKDYTRFYVNEIKFESVQELEIQGEFEKFVEETIKIHMRFDFEVKDRPTKNQQIQYCKKYFKQNILSYSNNNLRGEFNETINFDFIVDKYAFKFFVFKGKQQMRVINSIKAFAYNAHHLKGDYKVVAIVEDDSEDNNFEIVKKILENNCHDVITISKLMDYVKNIESHFVNKIC